VCEGPRRKAGKAGGETSKSKERRIYAVRQISLRPKKVRAGGLTVDRLRVLAYDGTDAKPKRVEMKVLPSGRGANGGRGIGKKGNQKKKKKSEVFSSHRHAHLVEKPWAGKAVCQLWAVGSERVSRGGWEVAQNRTPLPGKKKSGTKPRFAVATSAKGDEGAKRGETGGGSGPYCWGGRGQGRHGCNRKRLRR